jgi:hypothetical protein
MSTETSPYAWLFSGKQDDMPHYIRQSLALARELRADFHLDFFLHNRVLFQKTGACAEVRQDSIKVYLRGDNENLPTVGMKVSVYFSLRIDRKTLPCDFVSEVMGSEREGKDSFLLLRIPTDMGHNQRRYNVRIPVTKEDIGNFRVWYGKPEVGEDEAHNAKVQWVPFQPDHLDILDISAGGAHIGVTTSSPLLPLLSKGEMLLISGEFSLKGKSVSLAMVGPIVRLVKDGKMPWARIGVHYRRWAQVKQGGLNWLPLNTQEGIAPLASWVFQTMLERYRVEKGMDAGFTES